MPDTPRAWIFQGNPRYYDVLSALEDLEEVSWGVRRYAKDIHVSDSVYFWVTGGVGFVATGTVTTEPTVASVPVEEYRFYSDRAALTTHEARVIPATPKPVLTELQTLLEQWTLRSEKPC